MENYKDYVIQTTSGVEKGIFFRNPIQEITYDVYGDDSRFSVWAYFNKRKNRLFRIFQHLIGNGVIIDNIEKWINNDDLCGFSANILCFPIYFERNFRRLTAIAQDPELNIQKITSYGYESEFEICAGSCEVERTRFILKNGSTFGQTVYNEYQYTYNHKVKKLIDTDVIAGKTITKLMVG